jgi:membrane peptidoglycan carboxypeptidase
MRIEGGSTLAVQLEKFRHSEEGRTGSALEKLKQVYSASLKAYQEGPETVETRRQIVVDYLNSMPLAAAPGWGEVHGLNQGLAAWFGLDPRRVVSTIGSTQASARKRARAFKPVLALLCSVRAPSRYLIADRPALERRMNAFAPLLASNGVIESALARALERTPLEFASVPRAPAIHDIAARKGADAVRRALLSELGVRSLYDLDRLDLVVESGQDAVLNEVATSLFRDLGRSDFVAAHGLGGEHLLARGDPSHVIYSLLLFETTPAGNFVCAHADNLNRPFDLNQGMKMELGSTAKLRTLAHYLEIMEGLYYEHSSPETSPAAVHAQDPLTLWATRLLDTQGPMSIDSFLAASLERVYSANPNETFLTGGGLHVFHNFDSEDNDRSYSIREAAAHSTNLVFVRLMRDVVRYHEARRPYDAAAVLERPDDPMRFTILSQAADDECRAAMKRASQRWRETRSNSSNAPEDSVSGPLPSRPLERWCVETLARHPGLSWDELWSQSTEPRREASEWLFRTHNARAQETRLRTRIEQDAFAQMTPAWRRLDFPFSRLVPSLATAIGSSADRPAALAELMGIILNDGVRRPLLPVKALCFGAETPYETIFTPLGSPGDRVMSPSVAHALKSVIAGVVDHGTAQRLKGVFTEADGEPLFLGGKTGSGDNRYSVFSAGARLKGARPVNRTATFVFILGDRHFGVITASVLGREAGNYEFTSALPLEVLKLLAPAIEQHLGSEPAFRNVSAGSNASAPIPRAS